VKDPEQGALEEWKQLQTIIGRLDTLEYQHRGWLFVILGALVAGSITKPHTIEPGVFLLLGLSIVIIFCVMELMTRMPKRSSIDRAKFVEHVLQGKEFKNRRGEVIEYKGPDTANSLSGGDSTTFSAHMREFTVPGVWAFYIPLGLVIFMISSFSAATMPTAQPKTPSKPVQVTEKGWIISCSDKSEASSSAHGLPFMLFQTHIGGHFETLIFSSSNVPKCEMWRVRDVHELDQEPNTPRDYEITVIQHLNDKEDFEGTWDLMKMKSLADSGNIVEDRATR